MQITDTDINSEPIELDRREGDGITVSLLWRKAVNIISIAVSDERTSEEFELSVAPDSALDAFRHPFAYAARHGLLPGAAQREPVYA
jgi:hypothetical protein